MHEITHCHNQRPIYEINNSELVDWDNPRKVVGKKAKLDYPTYHPFVFDIETSAELNQRPILLVGYNTLMDEMIVLYAHGYNQYHLTEEKVEDMLSNMDVSPSRLIVNNLSISNFEKYVLRPIAEWNKKAKQKRDMNRISLVAHNAQFDIPMMGVPDDELLNNPHIGQQYEQAVGYKHVKMVSHRAGQFGQLFTFLDSANDYETMHIPVGDTLVASKAIWIPGALENACEAMNVDMDVTVSDEHGILTDEYVEYCLNDTVATLELYKAITSRIQSMFGMLPIEHIYSTASIGKYVLRKMGYVRAGYSTDAIDRIAPAYFGGRTDAEITGEIIENCQYTDILSEYPTVSKLTNVWEFMKAEYVTVTQIPVSELPTVDDLEKQETWSEIADYYVKIQPNGATLPIRTPHLADTTKVVTSQVNSDIDLQYHYMDVIAANLIDGEQKVDIKAAWKVEKHGTQQLNPVEVAGVAITPDDNVMAKSIEARKETQKYNKEHGIGDKNGKDEKTLSLKITANSLYGVSAERIVKERDGEKHDYASENGFYNPHVAATITAGGRLMLAFGENKAIEAGGRMYYCDTDSLILPDECTQYVIDAFNNLNPYNGYAGTLDVLEREKDKPGNLYAVGTKKYVFFANDGEVLEYKEHGLGNYENLRGLDNDGYNIIKRLWATIMQYDLGYNPLNVPILYDGALNELTLWSFNASTVSMRQMVAEYAGEELRYGDWLQSTLSYDDRVRYIGLNLMEKSDSETVVKVTTNNKEIESIKPVSKAEMDADSSLKRVKDVVMKFVGDTTANLLWPKHSIVGPSRTQTVSSLHTLHHFFSTGSIHHLITYFLLSLSHSPYSC